MALAANVFTKQVSETPKKTRFSDSYRVRFLPVSPYCSSDASMLSLLTFIVIPSPVDMAVLVECFCRTLDASPSTATTALGFCRGAAMQWTQPRAPPPLLPHPMGAHGIPWGSTGTRGIGGIPMGSTTGPGPMETHGASIPTGRCVGSHRIPQGIPWGSIGSCGTLYGSSTGSHGAPRHSAGSHGNSRGKLAKNTITSNVALLATLTRTNYYNKIHNNTCKATMAYPAGRKGKISHGFS